MWNQIEMYLACRLKLNQFLPSTIHNFNTVDIMVETEYV